MRLLFALCLLLVVVSIVVQASLYTGPFVDSVSWIVDRNVPIHREKRIKFTVALAMQNVDELKQDFLDVSMPDSPKYGQFYSLVELSERFSLPRQDRNAVVAFFETIPGANVHGLNHLGDMLTVEASIQAIESRLSTRLSYRIHKQGLTERKAIRADSPIEIPEDIQQFISFISLNSPVTHVVPRAGTALADQLEALQTGRTEIDIKLVDASAKASVESNVPSLMAKEDNHREQISVTTTATIGVTAGNEEALLSFIPVCGDGKINKMSPPCLTNSFGEVPQISVSVTAHANNYSDPYLLNTDPYIFKLQTKNIYCYSASKKAACNNDDDCTCLAKIGPLPKYQQLKASVRYAFRGNESIAAAGKEILLGSTLFFALTDVATASVLSDLYHIPQGLSVQFGSNQSVVEFYSEFYSNSDLLKFFALSGIPPATIPASNVLGDLANDESSPGGEAQLDVEYIMALAPGANTYFYSFSDLNPNDPENEGFLAYLSYVSAERSPPLVHSLSYGDVEATIFGTDKNSPDQDYGQRCDLEFLKLGLRGITVVFSSGDDGIGNFLIRDDPTLACSQAYPAWPASSPYVTTVGATQLTRSHLPACQQAYSLSASFGQVPAVDKLLFQCSDVKETVCSATIGGVITSGGGFSDVHERSSTAPWQDAAVNAYLEQHGDSIPELSYFNALGRGYPDVATYGSNYFVYLGGKITRESGTSASAPVFAAMVTLWNDMRLAANRPPMGFIAPFLYAVHAKHPSAFQDITTGDNACGAGHSLSDVNCCAQSFGAAPGWDAVTGLGSPNFEVIARIVLNANAAYPALRVEYDSSVGAIPSMKFEAEFESYQSAENTNSNIDVQSLAIAAMVLGCISTLLGLVAMYVAIGRRTQKSAGYSVLTSRGDEFKLGAASNFLLDEST